MARSVARSAAAARKKAANTPRKVTKPKRAPVKLSTLVGKLAEARALLECAMESVDDDQRGPWCVAVERAQQDLRFVDNGLDMMELRSGDDDDEDEDEEEEEGDEP